MEVEDGGEGEGEGAGEWPLNSHYSLYSFEVIPRVDLSSLRSKSCVLVIWRRFWHVIWRLGYSKKNVTIIMR